MKSVAVFLAFAAAVVIAGVADASDVGGRRARRRKKRDFGSEFGLSPTVGFGSGPVFASDGPFFASGGPFFASGRDSAVDRDFASGMGHSSSLKYGPGLGLSSPSSSEEEEEEQDSSSSVAPVNRDTRGPRQHVVASTTPRYATAAGPVPVPATRYVPNPVYVPAPYPASFGGPVRAADPFVVAAISYGPADPGAAGPLLRFDYKK